MPALEAVLYSGEISSGLPVAEFEDAFSRLIGAEHVVALSSGTAGLHLALILAGIQPRDEVISTAMTAEPTNMAILHAGGRVVWADVDSRNGNIAPESVRAAITTRTRAIMVVHYGGIPVDLEPIASIAEQHGIPVIEDAAHALGARYGGRDIGRHSRFVVFSFQAIKHMTTVDGGAIVCRDSDDATRARLLRWFGIDRGRARTDANVHDVGFKYNMNNVSATIGLTALPHVPSVVARYIDNGRYYDQELQLPGIELCAWPAAAEPSYWIYTVLADRRDELLARLRRHGIGAGLPHKRNDQHVVFAESQRPLPALDEFSRRYLHIPCGWWVTEEIRERVIDVVRDGW